jgi:hypothetical protein
MAKIFLSIILVSYSFQTDKANLVIDDFLRAVGGINKWKSFRTFHIETLSVHNLNENSMLIHDDIISHLESGLVIRDIRMPHNAIVEVHRGGKLESSFVVDEKGTTWHLPDGKTYSWPKKIVLPYVLAFIEWYETKVFEFVETKEFRGENYHIVKVYDDERKSWHYFYFNTQSHLLDYLHTDKHDDYSTLSSIEEYGKAEGVLYPKLAKGYKKGILFSRTETLQFQPGF